MSKILSTLLAILLFSGVFAQTGSIRGITVTGIKGIKKSLADILAQERSIPLNYKVHLRPELEGPRPVGQNPAAKAVSKSGTLVTSNNINNRVTATSPPTQAVNSNFLAIWGSYAAVAGRESPYTPPDNNGDVGTTQIIATANCRMKVFNKPAAGAALTTPTGSGANLLQPVLNVDLNVFFSNASLGISGISDPHVRFDRLSRRWFVIAIEVNHKTNNYCCIAVSDGETITDANSFTLYYFSVAQTGGASNDFFDYPTLGIDKNYLYIGGNMFANQSMFSGCNMWVVNKANLISSTPSLTVTGFPHTTANKTDIYTPQGVHNDDPGATQGYFVGASQTYYSKLNIKRVNYGATPTLSNDISLTTIQNYAPKTVPTLGGTAIDGNDRRLCAAMIKKNKLNGIASLWIAQGTRLNSAGTVGSTGDRDGALWMEIGNLTTTPVILQSANLYDEVHATSSAVYYTYPTIATSGQGHSVMGFTSAGPAKYAQAGAAGRYRTDPGGNIQAPIDLTTSTSTYNPGANRWGDYTQTVVDPSDDMTMWTFTEYAAATNAWGVRAVEFKAPPPATPVLATTPACGATTTVTINGTSTNLSEFFDPGTGYDKHINVTVSPNTIAVSNVTFVNQTQITALFDVPSNAASGPYTLTVINPDGQTSTTQFSLSCIAASCGDPKSLSSNVTNTTATVNWAAVSGATSYTVDYAIVNSNSWTPATVNGTSADISGLTAGTTYDWRVRATCSAVNGNYVPAQFTTTNTTTACGDPAGLSSSNITNTTATVSWGTVSGATSYAVDYAVAGTNNWSTPASTTSSTSVNLFGLTAGTNYDWRVASNCGTTPIIAQFTTTNDPPPPPCDIPTGLASTVNSDNTVTVNWSAASGANSYDVRYAVAGTNNWTPAATVTTLTSVNISGLNPLTTYDWNVRSNCSSSSSTYSASAQFTTNCADQYEPNNSLATAAAIPVATDIKAQIVTGTDVDYYSFSTSGNQKNLKVTLSNLPADYTLTLYNSNGGTLATSQQTGTSDKIVVYNGAKKPDTYKVLVSSTSGAYNTTQCYTLNVTTGNATFTATIGEELGGANNINSTRGGLKLFPVPASTAVTISFDAYAKGSADIIIINQLGQQVLYKKVLVNDGINFNTVDVSALKSGVYTVKVNNGKEIQTKKMIINK